MYVQCSYCYTYNEYSFPYSLNKCNRCYRKMYINQTRSSIYRIECKCDSNSFLNSCNICYKKDKKNYQNITYKDEINGKYQTDYYKTYK